MREKKTLKPNPVPFVLNKRSLTTQYPLGDLSHPPILEMDQTESILGFFLSDPSPSSLPRQFPFPFVLTGTGQSRTSFQVFHVFHHDNQLTLWILPTWVVVTILWSQVLPCNLEFLFPYKGIAHCFSNFNMHPHPLDALINADCDPGGLGWGFASLTSSWVMSMLPVTGSHFKWQRCLWQRVSGLAGGVGWSRWSFFFAL